MNHQYKASPFVNNGQRIVVSPLSRNFGFRQNCGCCTCRRPKPPCPPPPPDPCPPDPCCPKKVCHNQVQETGDQLALQGDQRQNQCLRESQGGLIAAQGSQKQEQGPMVEALGDLCQIQGGASQGNLCQGDQFQFLHGHGGQCQGDQQLINAPSISAPVNLNINADCLKKFDCTEACRKTCESLLHLIGAFSCSVPDPCDSEVAFYLKGHECQPLVGNLAEVEECFFTVLPAECGAPITLIPTALEALAVTVGACCPNLFSLLLNYLCAQPDCPRPTGEDGCPCTEALLCTLQCVLDTPIEIHTETHAFTGILYALLDGVAYLVDNVCEPTVIYAIPICQIIGYQPQVEED